MSSGKSRIPRKLKKKRNKLLQKHINKLAEFCVKAINIVNKQKEDYFKEAKSKMFRIKDGGCYDLNNKLVGTAERVEGNQYIIKPLE